MMTTKQVAKELGVSVRRVQALIEAGRLKAEKVGRDWLVREKDLAAVRDRPEGRPAKKGRKA